VTYLRVAKHWCYLAVVMDQFSRRVVGWSLRRVRGTPLTRAAFDHAFRRRRPRRLIFHSDRGIEYAAPAFRDRLKALGVRQSMTRGGTPGDNAHAESFFHSLKADVVHGVQFASDESLRSCVRRYVRYYNHERLHSSLGYRSPAEYERQVA
jgi:putative transposase